MTDYIPIGLIGISHKTAPVKIRDQVALSEAEQREALRFCKKEFALEGLLIVSTCNRTEVYISGENYHENLTRTLSWLSRFKNCKHYTNDSLTYRYDGYEAIEHFFQVISGMDSMIVGEPQITGQVKDAYGRAFELKTTDTFINKMFDFGLHAEKMVRSQTYLCDGAVSVSFAGVELARQIFSSFTDKTALLIGVGETAELAAKHFIEKGIGKVLIANRTESKAQKLAESLNGTAYALSHLDTALSQADIVISATASKDYIVTRDLVKPLCANRQYKPLLLIDLAMPRDIDPQVETLDCVYLYNLDHLNEIVALNLEKRHKEIPKAQKLLDESIGEFRKWITTHSMASVIGRLKSHFETVRSKELERLKNRLPDNGNAEIEYLTQSIINKLMHQHIKTLKKSASDPDRYRQQVDFLFDLYEIERDN